MEPRMLHEAQAAIGEMQRAGLGAARAQPVEPTPGDDRAARPARSARGRPETPRSQSPSGAWGGPMGLTPPGTPNGEGPRVQPQGDDELDDLGDEEWGICMLGS